MSAPVIRMWITPAPRSTGALSVSRASGCPGGVISTISGASSASAAPSSGAPGKSEAVCMSAPIPSTSTSIGSTAATRARRAPRIGSYMSTNCAAAAAPFSSVPRISRAFDRELSSETIRSSVGSTRTSRPGQVRLRQRLQERPRRRAPRHRQRRMALAGVGGAELVGHQLRQVAHQRVAVGISLPRHLDHAAISRQRWPSPPVSL